MRPIQTKLISALIILAVVLAVYSQLPSGGIQSAPAIFFSLIDGRQIALQELQTHPVLVTFWATTCPSCIKEIPHLTELYHQLKPKGLEIIAVAMPYDRPDHVVEMVKQKSIPYPVAIDIQGKAVTAFGNVRVTPTSFLIAPNGKIALRKTGELDIQQLQHKIQQMLKPMNQQKG